MALPTINASILAVDVCEGRGCPGCGDAQFDCVVVASSSLVAAGSPYLLVNPEGGDPAGWTEVAITEWTVGDADDVLCLGNFVGILSTTEAEVIRSSDRGVTRIQITNTDFAANPPASMFALDQSYVLIAGQNGYIYGSVDGLRTIETLLAGNAAITTQNLNKIGIAPDNPMVAWAVGASNAVVRTLNGGRSWEAVTGPSPTDDLIALWIESQNRLLVLNNDGELWQTEDSGETWSMQTALPSMPATPTGGSITRCGCDGFWMSVTDGTNSVVYRNIEGGAAGYWVVITAAPAQPVNDIACCDINTAIIVGGDGTDDGLVGLIS